MRKPSSFTGLSSNPRNTHRFQALGHQSGHASASAVRQAAPLRFLLSMASLSQDRYLLPPSAEPGTGLYVGQCCGVGLACTKPWFGSPTPNNNRSSEPLGKVTANFEIFPKRIQQPSTAGGEIPHHLKLLFMQLTSHSTQLTACADIASHDFAYFFIV